VTAQNASFVGNSADRGAAFYLGNTPGMLASSQPASEFVNLTVADNTAGSGAIIECSAADLELVSTVLADAQVAGSEWIRFTDATVNVSHSLVQGSGGSGAAWNPAYGTDLGGNLDANPGYAGAEDFHLVAGAPGIDAGDSGALMPGTTTDLDGNPRIAGEGVDMGAWEFQGVQEEPGDDESLFAASLSPGSLNPSSKGKFVQLTLTATAATPVDEIDPGTLLLQGAVSPEFGKVHVDDDTLNAKFDRSAFVAALEPAETVVVDVTGSLFDGTGFATTCEIRLVGRGFGAAAAAGPVHAFPNPFNPSTTVQFELERPMHVELAIYDLAGRLVKTLFSGVLPAGAHGEQWNGTDDSGRSVASGTYFASLRTEDMERVGRLVLVK
jgi:hypothetical protein